MEKTFAVYQRNACKSITDERDRAGSGENDLCQKKIIKPFAEHDLRGTLQCAGINMSINGNKISVQNGLKIFRIFKEIEKVLPQVNGNRKRMINTNFIL